MAGLAESLGWDARASAIVAAGLLLATGRVEHASAPRAPAPRAPEVGRIELATPPAPAPPPRVARPTCEALTSEVADRLAAELHAVHGPQWSSLCVGMLLDNTPALVVHVYAATHDWGLVVATGILSADATRELVPFTWPGGLVPRAAGDLDNDGNDEVVFSDGSGFVVQHVVGGKWVAVRGPAIARDCLQDTDIQDDRLLVDALEGAGCLRAGRHTFSLVGDQLVEAP